MSSQPGGGGKTPKSGARVIPTLTEVVRPKDLPRPSPAAAVTAPTTASAQRTPQAPAPVAAASPSLELTAADAMVHRVMQRVDLGLERRLRGLVSVVVAEHVSALAPKLRDAVEQAVRESVSEALSKELTTPPSAQVRPRGP